MAIRCGNCEGTHELVTQVRNCYDGDGTGMLHVDPDEEETRAERFLHATADRPGPTRAASEKQVVFIRALFSKKRIPDSLAGWAAGLTGLLPTSDRPNALGRAEARAAIGQLLKLEDLLKETRNGNAQAQESKGQITTDGMFRTDNGEIFKVQYAVHGTGRLYAKRLVLRGYEKDSGGEYIPVEITNIPLQSDVERDFNITFEAKFIYAPGAIYLLKPEWRMTIDEARKFGALYGTCIRCGLPLTREESIERGMGDICASKGNWA